MAVCRKRPHEMVHLLFFYARNQKVYQIMGDFLQDGVSRYYLSPFCSSYCMVKKIHSPKNQNVTFTKIGGTKLTRKPPFGAFTIGLPWRFFHRFIDFCRH